MIRIDGTSAPVFELPHLRVTGLASPSRGAAATCVWRLALAPGAPGVLHGVYTPAASVILNGLSHEFDSADDLAVRYDDPQLGLGWDVQEPVLSPRDRDAPAVADLLDRLAADGVAWPPRDA